jgi:hypothetical protein
MILFSVNVTNKIIQEDGMGVPGSGGLFYNPIKQDNKIGGEWSKK